MSILIRDMEMPTSCYECPVECEGDLCGITQGGCTWDERPPHCPLIPVPPHGRLIDADALLQNHARAIDSRGRTHIVSSQAIKNAPIIIPAEEATE